MTTEEREELIKKAHIFFRDSFYHNNNDVAEEALNYAVRLMSELRKSLAREQVMIDALELIESNNDAYQPRYSHEGVALAALAKIRNME